MRPGHLLDTNVLIDLSEGRPPAVLLEAAHHPPVLSTVVLGEFLAGLRHPERACTRRAEAWIKGFLLDVRVVAVTADTASRYADLYLHRQRTGHPIPRNDLWIAATAAERGLTLLTCDQHFADLPGVDVEVVEPAGTEPDAG